MDNNYTVLTALLTAVAAIIAPVISNIVSCIKEYRVKKMEIVYTQKLKLITEFTNSYEHVSRESNHKLAAKAQGAASALAAICKNKETRDKLIELSDYLEISQSRSVNTSDLFNECIKLIAKEMSESHLSN